MHVVWQIINMSRSLLTDDGLQQPLTNSRQRILSPPSSPDRPNSPSPPTKIYSFPRRSFLNILLIFLTTLQIVLILQSPVYITTPLLRSFLTIYTTDQSYPQLFNGQAFYVNIDDAIQLQQVLVDMMQAMKNSQEQTLVDMNFTNADITLQIQYNPGLQEYQTQRIVRIDPQEGIVRPFDPRNITSLKRFLLKIHYFQIVVDNLWIKSQGLQIRYFHRVNFHYDDGNLIQMSFQFKISQSQASSIQVDNPSMSVLMLLRVFYVGVMVLAAISMYMNISFIRRMFMQFYRILRMRGQRLDRSRHSIADQLTRHQITHLDAHIVRYIQAKDITLSNLKWQDHINIIQFDIIFSLIANLFQIISNFLLLFGRQHERLVGLACLFAWMTIFRILKQYKKLILMYQLIKLSILKIIQFLLGFFLVFMGYTFLGMCFFPKVKYFFNMSNSVTTLAAMMAGDSIQQITNAICGKNSRVLAIGYIFSYVFVFMHAIHNTLTSIIKEFFILKKIQGIEEEKERKKQAEFRYLGEIKTQGQQRLRALPVKLGGDMKLKLFKAKMLQAFKGYNKVIRKRMLALQSVVVSQKWMIQDYYNDQTIRNMYKDVLKERYHKITKMIQEIDGVSFIQNQSKAVVSQIQLNI